MCCGWQAAKETSSRTTSRSCDKGTANKRGIVSANGCHKTASNKEYNDDLSIMVAWCAINDSVLGRRKAGPMNLQLIIPYMVDKMQGRNPLSLIEYTRGSDCDIVDLHFFPSTANDVLKTVRPVISPDAAHLWSDCKGMLLYMASVLLGGKDIHPAIFMIASGNKDRKMWTKMLRLLKKACPIICEQGFRAVNQERDVDMHPRSQFLFLSDRDKGLKPALKEVFLDKQH